MGALELRLAQSSGDRSQLGREEELPCVLRICCGLVTSCCMTAVGRIGRLYPADYVHKATTPSPYNPHYAFSLQFELNTDGASSGSATRRVLEAWSRRVRRVRCALARLGDLEDGRSR